MKRKNKNELMRNWKGENENEKKSSDKKKKMLETMNGLRNKWRYEKSMLRKYVLSVKNLRKNEIIGSIND